MTILSDLSLFFRKLRPVDGANALEDGTFTRRADGGEFVPLPPKAEVTSSNLVGRASGSMA